MVKREPPTRRTQAERSEATRTRLLVAGRRLFESQGYAATGREEIAAAAGVTRGALQHHFGDKRSLFRAVYESVEAELVAATALAAMAAGDDPVDQLRDGCRAYLDAVLDPALQRVCALDGPAVLGPAELGAITDRYALGLVRQAVESAIASGAIEPTPPEPLARMLLAAVMAAAQYVATAEDPRRARVEAGRTVDALLDGLRRRPSPGSAPGVSPRAR